MENKFNFKADNPGAVQYGNFINYYQFHSPEARLKLLPHDIWSFPDALQNECTYILDIGCNSGDLTYGLYNFLKEKIKHINILGIDIDSTLIKRAQEVNTNENITFLCLDFIKDIEILANYMKSKKISKFSIIFCFSVTMWIHLNYGDEGLASFLKKICDLGHLIVIEPQPWKCYKSAVKRMKLAKCEFPHFKTLKIRHAIEEEISNILRDLGAVKVGETTDRTKWGRKIVFYKT